MEKLILDSIINKILIPLKELILILILGFIIISISRFLVTWEISNSLIAPPIRFLNLNDFLSNLFLVLIWIAIYLALRAAFIKANQYRRSLKEYRFKSSDWPKKWLHQGNVRLRDDEENALYVTDSNSGCILKSSTWKNLEVTFDCKFPNDGKRSILGIIFRAKSLSNYLMIQINNEEKRLTPHIRMQGSWETIDYDLDSKIAKDTDFKVKLKVVEEEVTLFIEDVFKIKWNIPTNTDINLDRNSNDPDVRRRDYKDDYNVPLIDNKRYGMFGFRAYYNESAIVKNIIVKRIQTFA